jgi:coproporphyrinogen III oxidase-like Fe-S oxidoreductase
MCAFTLESSTVALRERHFSFMQDIIFCNNIDILYCDFGTIITRGLESSTVALRERHFSLMQDIIFCNNIDILYCDFGTIITLFCRHVWQN